MNSDDNAPESFSWARRWSAGLSLLIAVAAVLALVGMFNYLAIRHFTRFHWNRDTEAALSSRTEQVLRALTNNVKVTVYFKFTDPLFPRIKGLLKEYQFASPRIQVQYVDYMHDAAAALKVKETYKLTSANDKDVVIFDSNGGQVVANSGELSDYDYSNLIAGKSREVPRSGFKGEMVFTSKIYQLAVGKKTIAYYLVENGEHQVDDNPDSYGRFVALLRDENNFEIRPLGITGTNEIPPDCNLLIIAGPTTPLASVEVARLDRYLEQGGRALIALNYVTVGGRSSGLEKLLAKWGVETGDNIILDRRNSVSGTGEDLMPADYGRHEIVNSIRNRRLLLFKPRSVGARRPENRRTDDSKVTELLFTGRESVVIDARRRMEDPTQAGARPVMAVVEKSAPALQRGATRIVVLGDSFLWDNSFIQADANGEFAAATANWLVNQSVLLAGIPPRQLRSYKITMTQTQLRSVQWILSAGVPGAVLLFGVLVWWRRRR